MTLPELEPGEELLTEGAELLWRNVHPDFLDGDEMSSQAFRPTPKDAGRMSTARQSRVSAEGHYGEYTENLELQSAGVWAVSVDEVSQQQLRAVADEKAEQPPQPFPRGHAYVDFRATTTTVARRLGGRLRTVAVRRGRQHPPAE